MSVSKTVALLCEKEEANVAAAQEQQKLVHLVLSGIHSETEGLIGVSKHGYCAQASLLFKGTGLARKLLELYPPLDCVDITGSSKTQKPAKYVRDEDRYSGIVPIFPVCFKSSKTEQEARWWTSLNGMDVEVHVEGASPAEFEVELNSSKYVRDSHSYSSGSVVYFARALANPTVRPGSQDPVQQAADFEAVRAWFEAFFCRFSHFYENSYEVSKRIKHQLRKDTGLDVQIRMMRQTGRKVRVSPYFDGIEKYPDYSFDLSADQMAPAVKPQDLDVEYL